MGLPATENLHKNCENYVSDQKTLKFSNIFRMSECIRMHLHASQCIRTSPNAFQQVRASPKTSKNLRDKGQTLKICRTNSRPGKTGMVVRRDCFCRVQNSEAFHGMCLLSAAKA